VVEIATQAEANTGTADDKVLTPAKLASISPTSVTYDSSDQVLILDASDSNKLKRATITTSLSPSIDIYSASATWVCPTGVSKVVLTAVGGGGGGATTYAGGTGGYGISVVTVSAGATYQVSVGAGGNGGVTGINGGATWFGVNSSSKLIESTGGGGGAAGAAGANGTSDGTLVKRNNAPLHFIFGGSSPRTGGTSAVAWSSAASATVLHAGAAGTDGGGSLGSGAVGGVLMIEYWS
jgi:hypothetical protein